MFEVLADEGINIEMISTSTIRITCVVARADGLERARAASLAHRLRPGLEQAYSAPLPERR